MTTTIRIISILALLLSMGFVGGCSQPMQSSLVVEPRDSTTLQVLEGTLGTINFVNHGQGEVEIGMLRGGAMSAVQFTLQPGGECRAGLRDVYEIVIYNTSHYESLVSFNSTGPGSLLVTPPHTARVERFSFVER